MEFDRGLLKPEVGLRAVWLLYKRGKWGLLEDLGVERKVSEAAFVKFDDTIAAPRLNKVQALRLEQEVPGVREASVELRLAYALKFYEATSTKAIKEGLKYQDEILSRRS